MIKNLFFDMWGTLAYLTGNVDIAGQISDILGIKKENYSKIVHNIWYKNNISSDIFAKYLIKEFKADQKNINSIVALLKCPIKKSKLYEDVPLNIKRLSSQYQIFLISDSSSIGKNAAKKLDLIKQFNQAFFSCDYRITKAEGLYEKAFSLSNLEPSQCMVIGNSEISDYILPKKLGADALLINRGSKRMKYKSISGLGDLK